MATTRNRLALLPVLSVALAIVLGPVSGLATNTIVLTGKPWLPVALWAAVAVLVLLSLLVAWYQARAGEPAPDGDNPLVAQIPALEAAVAALERGHAIGNPAGVELRAQLDKAHVARRAQADRAAAPSRPVVRVVRVLDPAADAILRGVGVLAAVLPWAVVLAATLAIGSLNVPPSLSAAYYTGARDVLVGGWCAIGVLMLAARTGALEGIVHQGIGCVAVALALLPTAAPPGTPPSSARQAISTAHFISISVLFVLLAICCFLLYPRSEPGRRPVYLVCGAVVVLGMALALGTAFVPGVLDGVHAKFWGEAVMVTAFGVACFVRGSAATSAATAPAPAAG